MQQARNIQSHKLSNTLATTSFYSRGKISKPVFLTKLVKEITSMTATDDVLLESIHDQGE
jgi:hypothetical protein